MELKKLSKIGLDYYLDRITVKFHGLGSKKDKLKKLKRLRMNNKPFHNVLKKTSWLSWLKVALTSKICLSF